MLEMRSQYNVSSEHLVKALPLFHGCLLLPAAWQHSLTALLLQAEFESMLGMDGMMDLDPLSIEERDWGYANPNTALFSFTVLSTIGYGNFAPSTNAGKLFLLLFAVIGIPVNMISVRQRPRVSAVRATLLTPGGLLCTALPFCSLLRAGLA